MKDPGRKGLWAAWLSFLDEKEAATSLAVFRLALGLCTLALVGTAVWRDLPGVIWVDKAYGGYRSIDPSHPLLDLAGGATPLVAWTCALASLTGGLLVTLGLFGRASAFLALMGVNLLVHLNGEVSGGYDRLLTNGLWLLVLCSSTTTLSLDCYRRTGGFTSERAVKVWPRYVAMLQLVVVYWMAGLNKVGASWTPAGGFSALYYILMQPDWQRFDMRFLAWVYPLTQLGTALTWLWELSWPVMLLWLWARSSSSKRPPGRLRRWLARYDLRLLYLGTGVIMHTLTWALMEVGPFSWVTLSFYACFVRPSEWSMAYAWLTRRMRGT